MARGAAVAGRIALPTFPTTAPSDAGGEADESDDPITLLLLTRWGPVLAVWTVRTSPASPPAPPLTPRAHDSAWSGTLRAASQTCYFCFATRATRPLRWPHEPTRRPALTSPASRPCSPACSIPHPPAQRSIAWPTRCPLCARVPLPAARSPWLVLTPPIAQPASLDVADACPRQLRSFWAMDHEERDVWTRGPPTAAAIPTADCADSYGEFWLTGATLLCCGTPVGPPLPRRRQHAGQRRIAALERLQRAQRRAHLALAEWADSLPATRDAEALRRARQLLRSLHAQHDRLRRRVARARILPRALRIADRRRRRPCKIAAAAAATPAARRLTTARARPAGAAGGCLTAAVEACLCAAVCVLALWMVVRAVEACCVPEPEPGPL